MSKQVIDAMNLVLELAYENALTEELVEDDPDLSEEYDRQQAAIATVEGLIDSLRKNDHRFGDMAKDMKIGELKGSLNMSESLRSRDLEALWGFIEVEDIDGAMAYIKGEENDE